MEIGLDRLKRETCPAKAVRNLKSKFVKLFAKRV